MPGRAEPALEGVALVERRLYGVQLTALGEALDRGDVGPLACTASTLQDFTLRPSRWTVQAPQLLVSHPITVPVLPSFSRRYCTSSIRGSTSSVTCRPVDGEFDPGHACAPRGRGKPLGVTGLTLGASGWRKVGRWTVVEERASASVSKPLQSSANTQNSLPSGSARTVQRGSLVEQGGAPWRASSVDVAVHVPVEAVLDRLGLRDRVEEHRLERHPGHAPRSTRSRVPRCAPRPRRRRPTSGRSARGRPRRPSARRPCTPGPRRARTRTARVPRGPAAPSRRPRGCRSPGPGWRPSASSVSTESVCRSRWTRCLTVFGSGTGHSAMPMPSTSPTRSPGSSGAGARDRGTPVAADQNSPRTAAVPTDVQAQLLEPRHAAPPVRSGHRVPR